MDKTRFWKAASKAAAFLLAVVSLLGAGRVDARAASATLKMSTNMHCLASFSVDGATYSGTAMFKDKSVQGGSIVKMTQMKRTSADWYYYDLDDSKIYIGKGVDCYFRVPQDASGAATLDFHSNSSQTQELIKLKTSTGWAQNLTFAMSEEELAKDEYTIEFDANGGTGTMSSMSAEKNKKTELPDCGFERYCYEFIGWSENKNATVPAYLNKGEVMDIAEADETIILYAIWRRLENVEEYYLPTGPSLNEYFAWIGGGKDSVLGIHFTHEIPESYEDKRGLKGESITGNNKEDGPINMYWVKPNPQEYKFEVYVYSNGKMKASEDMSHMFDGYTKIKALDMAEIDTSEVIDMSYAFRGVGSGLKSTETIEVDLSTLDTSEVTNMGYMFSGCKLNDLDLSHFNTSNVRDMNNMFDHANINALNASSFDTPNLTNATAMFFGFNSSGSLDLRSFNTSMLKSLNSLFRSLKCKSLDLSSFDTSKVTSMENAFEGIDVAQGIDIRHFDYSSATDLSYMFRDANMDEIKADFSTLRLTQDGIDTDNMFAVTSDHIDLPALGFGKVRVTGNYMFSTPSIKWLDLSGVTVKSGYNMFGSGVNEIWLPEKVERTDMTLPATFVDINGNKYTKLPDRNSADVIWREGSPEAGIYHRYTDSGVTPVSGVKRYADDCQTLVKGPDFKDFIIKLTGGMSDTRPIAFNSIEFTHVKPGSYDNCCDVTDGAIYSEGLEGNITAYWIPGTKKVVVYSGKEIKANRDMTDMFSQFSRYYSSPFAFSLRNLDTSETEIMDHAFACNKIKSDTLKNLDMTHVKSARDMFEDCTFRAKTLVLDTPALEDASGMFRGASINQLKIGIDTSKVKDMSSMFEESREVYSLDISGFDTSNAENMSRMFYGCRTDRTGYNDLELDLSGFDTSKVTDMSYMFKTSMIKNTGFPNFDTSNVTDMRGMFESCNYVESLDLSNFDTAKVTAFNGMFEGCRKLEYLDISGFTISNRADVGDGRGERFHDSPDARYHPFGTHHNYQWASEFYRWNYKNPMFAYSYAIDEIRTPKATISGHPYLPGYFVDKAGNTYAEMPASSTAEVIYRRGSGRATEAGAGTPSGYEAYTYYVAYNANTGTGSMETDTFRSDTRYKLKKNTFTKDGFMFLGWSLTPGSGDVDFSDEETVLNIGDEGETIDLYAVWGSYYTIQFDPNGGTGYMSPVRVACGQEVSLPRNAFEKKDSEFLVWSLDKDNKTGRFYFNGDAVKDLAEKNETVILYAIWEGSGTGDDPNNTEEPVDPTVSKNYIIRFNANGGTGEMDDLPMKWGEAKELPLNQFKNGDFRFAGWALSPSGGAFYADGAKAKNLTDKDGEVVTLYARWNKEGEVEVIVEVESSYKVILPASVALAKNTLTTLKNYYAAGYVVAVEGDLESGKFVNVTPSETDGFILKDASGKRNLIPDVYANGVSWSASELEAAAGDKVGKGSMIEVEASKSGRYSGNLAYNFWLGDDELDNAYPNTSKTGTSVDDDGKLSKH